MNWFLLVVRNYVGFQGRARRKEYWYYFLFYVIFNFVALFVDYIAGTIDAEGGVGLFSTVYVLGLLLPSLAVLVRRLHDTDRSGWWVLINLIPLVGVIVTLVFTVQDSTPGTNRFGPNPKEQQ
ncbi:MAG: DUF805 domain-containing protein [Gammaproteobacteria bacterium]|jgi:uncharacterized membrane protein YhaH (DUF805 family)